MNQPYTPPTPVNKAQERAFELLIIYEVPEQKVLEKLVKEEGLSPDEATRLIAKVKSPDIVKSAEDYKRANRDILWGSIWFSGGLVLTIAKTGYIFWGAIIIGGIQLGRGIYNRLN